MKVKKNMKSTTHQIARQLMHRLIAFRMILLLLYEYPGAALVAAQNPRKHGK